MVRITLRNYLNAEEEILYEVKIQHKRKDKIKEDVLGYTQTRIFHYRRFKGRNRIYRDLPVRRLGYLENGWHDRNYIILLVGALIVALGAFFGLEYMGYVDVIPSLGEIYPGMPYSALIAGVALCVGIALVILGTRQFGYLVVNNDRWKFNFKRKDSLKDIEDFIQNVYFAKKPTRKISEPESSEVLNK